jgi:preprotein translocase subunit SecD
MHRASFVSCLVVVLFAGGLQGQSRLSIRAASAEPVEGWQRMPVEHSNGFVWVSAVEAVTTGDIEQAEPELNFNGDKRIAVVFTDAGLRKIGELTTAQRGKHIAMVVDRKVMWAPIVQQTQAGKKGVLTGNGPHGLTQDEVELIMSILRPGQPR